MRIGIDARFYDEAGIGRYIRNLIERLQTLDFKNEYFIFLLDKHLNKVHFNDNFHPVKADFHWYGFSEQRMFPKLLRKYKLDLVHFPHFNIPVFYKGKFVVTIHDLIHQNYKMKRASSHGSFIYNLKHSGYNLAFRVATSKSQKIITVSDYVRDELIKKWKIKEDKIVVTKEAVEDKFILVSKKITKKQIKKVLAKFKIEGAFIYYLGNAHPHKNVEGLIKAYLKIKESHPDLSLVLSGHDHYFWERLKKENQFEGIIYTGYVSDYEAIAILKSALVYVQPSFEEGFGIPILEAMSTQTPVACSNAASLPEVGGEAALYFNPSDIVDMIQEITSLIDNPEKRLEYIKKGNLRYNQFSWEKLAEQTLKIYTSV